MWPFSSHWKFCEDLDKLFYEALFCTVTDKNVMENYSKIDEWIFQWVDHTSTLVGRFCSDRTFSCRHGKFALTSVEVWAEFWLQETAFWVHNYHWNQ